MKQKFKSLLLLLIAIGSGRLVAAPPQIEWHLWSDTIFAEARQQNRFVLLDLEAVWCHWCHVMDHKTYSDPKVIELIRARYIAVRVDQDARPDLSNRYEDYGWPATVVFGPDGKELVKRQGYIAPDPMASMLQAIIDDPTPGPSVLASEEKTETGRFNSAALRERLLAAYDAENLGWGTVHKFLDWDIAEYGLSEPADGLEKMVRDTLDAQLGLMDPVWGGVYQYSTDGDWKHPHYEKLMQFQAENLRIYALAYARWADPVYLRAAESIRRYIRDFLTSPEGAFYTSQDADVVPGEHSAEYFSFSDEARRKAGIPRVDQHIYARENGWTANALATLFALTGNKEYLDAAITAVNWIIAHRALPGGGFRHGEDSGGYLGDTLAMGRAFLTLYAVTGNRPWLDRAKAAADFIDANFRADSGFRTSANIESLEALPQLDENVAVARFTNLLGRYIGSEKEREMSDHAMKYLTSPGVAADRGIHFGSILLAERELAKDPLHITIVGSKQDARAGALFSAALKYPDAYKRTEWWDRQEGPLPQADVEYPTLDKPAAFLCTNSSCSAPISSPEKLLSRGK